MKRMKPSLTLAVAAIAALCLLTCPNRALGGPNRTADPPSGDATGPDQSELEEEWGVRIESLRLSAAGYFIDFRYKVQDPDKAAALADQAEKPYLIDQATGARLPIPTTPKLGPLRQTAQKLEAGKIYFMFFSNARGLIKSGSQVTVVVGDRRIENLTVE
jgi:hypothetical protein